MNAKSSSLPIASLAARSLGLARFARGRLLPLLDELIAGGRLDLTLPDGSRHQIGPGGDGAPRATVSVRSWRAFGRLLFGGDLGFAESYLAGEWDSPDLEQVFRLATANESSLRRILRGNALTRRLSLRGHRRNANTRRGSRRNIAAHYDLGNAFYAQWLDPTLFYSSGLFDGDHGDLERAQRVKFDAVFEMAGIDHGHDVLEIGCGWGSFADLALDRARVRLTGLTLSTEQLAHAERRLDGRDARFRLTDYRDAEGTYDRVVSIEMFEAVGEDNWPAFFGCLHDRLRPGGVAAIQVITIEDHRFETYRRRADFIQKHVFPGGMLPSPERFRAAAARAGLAVEAERFFGSSYARTLRLWRQRFQRAWPDIRPLGFDDRFRRLWDYYLLSCAAGFDAGIIDVGIFRLRRPA